jgi:hypothetical protein
VPPFTSTPFSKPRRRLKRLAKRRARHMTKGRRRSHGVRSSQSPPRTSAGRATTPTTVHQPRLRPQSMLRRHGPLASACRGLLLVPPGLSQRSAHSSPHISPLFSSQEPTLLLTGALSSPHISPLFSSQEPSLLLTGAHSSPHRSPLFSSQEPSLLLTSAHSSPHRSPLFSSQEPTLLLTGALIRLASGYAALAAASASA